MEEWEAEERSVTMKDRDYSRLVGCTSKRAYETYGAAARALRLQLKRGIETPRGLHVYRCRFCHEFHLGHRQEREMRKRPTKEGRNEGRGSGQGWTGDDSDGMQ